MGEWFNLLPWKGSVGKLTGGSNPPLSTTLTNQIYPIKLDVSLHIVRYNMPKSSSYGSRINY